MRAHFIVEDRCAELLAAIYLAASQVTREHIRAHLIGLPQLADWGHSWAKAIRRVPTDDWTPAEVQSLLNRAGDNLEVAEAITAVGVRRDPERRATNESALRVGDINALAWIGPVTDVPKDAVPSLIGGLREAIQSRVAQMRKGMHGRYPGIEPGQALVVMNVSFPDDADWEPITELLAEPRATGSLLVETIRAIEASASRIDGSLRDRLLETLTSLAGRAPQPAIPVLIVDARPAARAAIDAISNAVVPAVQWLSARDTRSREAMILSLARRTNPDDLSALTVLATDPDSRTRAAVASALSYWLVSSVPSESISETLAALLADDTTLAARRAVAEWPDEPDERLRPLAEQLRSHPSAKVRAAALRIVGV